MSVVSAHSAQKELNVLKHLLRLAVEWELIPINPAKASDRRRSRQAECDIYNRVN